ncbi:MAG: YabP/YqfC family sporulation protein [Eubacteriales bacterium]
MKNKKIGRPGAAELLSRLADVPADVLCGGMTLELRGRNELLLCGCREITEYSEELLRVKLGNCDVAVMGRRLTMSSYSGERVAVRGEIDGIDLCGGKCFEKKEE